MSDELCVCGHTKKEHAGKPVDGWCHHGDPNDRAEINWCVCREFQLQPDAKSERAEQFREVAARFRCYKSPMTDEFATALEIAADNIEQLENEVKKLQVFKDKVIETEGGL